MAKLWSAKNIGRFSGATALVGAGTTGVGVATVLGSLLRAAMSYTTVDDGPDPLLAPPAVAPRRSTVTTADGAVLNVLTYGPDAADSTGDIVVMVHGWTCNTDYWLPQINHLLATDPGRTIVAYDQRGHGDSTMGHARTTADLIGRDFNAVLGAVLPAGRKAVVMGHSMGGMTIQTWAQQFHDQVPQQLSHVLLVSTAAEQVLQRLSIAPSSLPKFAEPFRVLTGWLVASTPAPTPHIAGGEKVIQYVAMADRVRAAHLEFVDEMVTACHPVARASCGSALAHLDALSALDVLAVPTTVVVGSEDKLLPPLQSDIIADRLRRNGFLHDYVVWEGIGHMASIEAGAEFNELLDAVLGRRAGELAS
ncbi:alpha/beta hydrolase [Gordonia sp. TBRC 11910]|uniref:Alpha/beta hydrolase n=1 Tax=Gordonia asplenii TaxID=2725283 RepID=A0A848KQX6_9ACTN|nr:alpha/beta hydrolase [Gordonia asplenii]NMO00770.1 alpha/beta hydrolase [Gordonia asplenii]